MLGPEQTGLVLGAVALGFVHGVEPGHGWPVAASYALDQPHRWAYGLAASVLLGIGHLVSSIAMVAVFFWAKSYFQLTQLNDPVHILGVPIGGPVGIVAGALLIALGIRELRKGHHHGHEHSHDRGRDHSHNHGHDHSHDHGQDHSHNHGKSGEADKGILSRLWNLLPIEAGHDHPDAESAAERGLWGIAGFAFLLGFAHEEEFEIIAICMGTEYCLSLMLVYAATVIVGIVGLTLLLIAGYHRFEERAKGAARHFPTISAAILVAMGTGFSLGLI